MMFLIGGTYESTPSVYCGKQRLSFESEPWSGRWEKAEDEQSVIPTYQFSPIFLVLLSIVVFHILNLGRCNSLRK